jgi:TPR repeat protein
MKGFVLSICMLVTVDGYAQDFGKMSLLAWKGDSAAQNNIAVSFITGKGVDKNIDSAFYWFSESAEAGVAYAQYNLGLLYQQGRGTLRDDSRAEIWHLKAAKQGVADAQFA